MTEERKDELRLLLNEAMACLEIRPRSSNSSQSRPVDVHNYRRLLQQRWTFYSESSLAILRTYDPHIVSEAIKSKLIDFIREEFAPFIHEDRIQSASLFLIGGLIRGSLLDELLEQLMKIAIAQGIEEAVLVFDKSCCSEDIQGFYQYIVLLDGIKLKKEIQMFDGIRLVPLSDSTSELPYYLPSVPRGGPENFFSKKTLLVIDYLVSPIFHKPFQASTMQEYEDQRNSIFRTEINSKDFLKFKMDDFPLGSLCQALSLACHSEVRISFAIIFLAEDKLYNLNHRMGGGGSWDFRPPGNVTEADQPQIDEAKRLFGILMNLDSGTVKKLQIPIDRWIKSTANKDSIDKIIDLGIALESLYLSGPESKNEIRFRFSLHAAWYLGENKEHREELMKKFKAIYDWRSTVVHTGKLPEKGSGKKKKPYTQEEVREFIRNAQDLCRDSIMKILKKKKFPDWNNLILG